MSQEQLSDAVASPPVGAGDGLFRPGRTQRETLLTVLRLAARYEQWVTLAELAGKTKYPPASISAQLRHLRKAHHGGYHVEKRHRCSARGVATMRKIRDTRRGPVIWEYRVLPPA